MRLHKTRVIYHQGKFVSEPYKELKDILKAYGAISLAFAIVLTRQFVLIPFLINLGMSALTVGVGFVFHELAHRTLARRFKCRAEFRSFDYMLVFAIIISFLGFVFAAPGAVFISGDVDKRKNGIISLSGPLTNLVLALLFFIPLFFVSKERFLFTFLSYGFIINTWLGVFNLIPVANFDGKKIFSWSKVAWTITLVFGITLFIGRIFI
ncbi:site-2 protease family protein [Candidatus Woesearchaeota archaeon]|nr:MAG: site-2 protease family protein [Candidatus Woesearchaeota archaeon]